MAGSLDMLLHDAKLLREGGDDRAMLLENMGDVKEAIIDTADHIERLQAENARLREEVESLLDRLKDADHTIAALEENTND